MRYADLPSPTLLVRLASPQGDRYALGHQFDVRAINCTELRPPEGPSETDQEECSVATVAWAVAEDRQHGQAIDPTPRVA